MTPTKQKRRSETDSQSCAIMEADAVEKREVVLKLEELWGPRFVIEYIPKETRPFVGRPCVDYDQDSYWSRPKSPQYQDGFENDPNEWPLPVLKALLRIARRTSDRRWVMQSISIIVEYRIDNSSYFDGTEVTVGDCEVLESALVNNWELHTAMDRHMDAVYHSKRHDESVKERDDDSDYNTMTGETAADARGVKEETPHLGLGQGGLEAVSVKEEPKGKFTQPSMPPSCVSVFPRAGSLGKRMYDRYEMDFLVIVSAAPDDSEIIRDYGFEILRTPDGALLFRGFGSSFNPEDHGFPASNPMHHGDEGGPHHEVFDALARATMLPAQNTSESQHASDKTFSDYKSDSPRRKKSMSVPRQRATNSRVDIKRSNHDVEDDDDSDDSDDDIINAQIAAAEAELNLARLRLEAARRAKKAKKQTAMSL